MLKLLTLCHPLEDLGDILASLGTGAEVVDSKTRRIALTFLQGNLSARFEIRLIGDHNNRQSVPELISQFLHPVRHFLEAIDISNIVDNQGTLRVSIVDRI